jgi:hypothetical protein
MMGKPVNRGSVNVSCAVNALQGNSGLTAKSVSLPIVLQLKQLCIPHNEKSPFRGFSRDFRLAGLRSRLLTRSDLAQHGKIIPAGKSTCKPP